MVVKYGLSINHTSLTVEIGVFLFGKPAWEINGFEGADLDDELIGRIREKGKDLNESLNEAADILKKLLQNGWNGTGTLYDVSLFKDISLGEARKELAQLGLDPDMAFEFDDDEDEYPSGPAMIER